MQRVRRTAWKRGREVTTDGDDGGGWKLSFQHKSVQKERSLLKNKRRVGIKNNKGRVGTKNKGRIGTK